jgi:O-antigen ligase
LEIESDMTLFSKAANFLNLLLFVALALASVSTKWAGAAWLLMLVWGLALGLRSARVSTPNNIQTAATAWLIVCALALLVRAMPVVFWNDPWEERHAEFRLLLGALGIWGLTRVRGVHSTWAIHGLAIAGGLGLGLTLRGGRDGLPTNAIPWAGGMALVCLMLLHSTVLLAKTSQQRWYWGLGAGAALAAVLVSETRGAYGVALWAGAWLLWQWRKKLTLKSLALAVLIAIALLVGLRNTALVQTPLNRVLTAVSEMQGSQTQQEGAQNSSVGARVELWKLAAQAVPQKPWLGHGHDERLNLIKKWGRDHDSEVVTSLGHMHNQYLHDLMDHGILGLISGLIYILGLTVLSIWLLKQKQAFAGWTLGGVAFMHATANLTNVNFAHNYYPTIMSIVVGLALLGGRQEHARASDR